MPGPSSDIAATTSRKNARQRRCGPASRSHVPARVAVARREPHSALEVCSAKIIGWRERQPAVEWVTICSREPVSGLYCVRAVATHQEPSVVHDTVGAHPPPFLVPGVLLSRPHERQPRGPRLNPDGEDKPKLNGIHRLLLCLIFTGHIRNPFPGISDFPHTKTCWTGSSKAVANPTHTKKAQGAVM